MLIGAFRPSLRLLLIGRFQSLSFRLEIVPSAVRLGTDWLLCCLIVGIHAFWNFNSIIPVDVVRVKSYVNSLFNPTGIPMWVSVNKLNLIPERIVARRIAAFWNGRGLGSSKPYVSIVFSLIRSVNRSSRVSNIDLATLAGNLVDYSVLFCWIDNPFGRPRCDLSIVSDLKTVRIPCCCRQRWRASDNPLYRDLILYIRWRSATAEIKLIKTAFGSSGVR